MGITCPPEPMWWHYVLVEVSSCSLIKLIAMAQSKVHVTHWSDLPSLAQLAYLVKVCKAILDHSYHLIFWVYQTADLNF